MKTEDEEANLWDRHIRTDVETPRWFKWLHTTLNYDWIWDVWDEIHRFDFWVAFFCSISWWNEFWWNFFRSANETEKKRKKKPHTPHEIDEIDLE